MLTPALVLSFFFENISFMICHVKTLDTWANRTWKWSEIMISTNREVNPQLNIYSIIQFYQLWTILTNIHLYLYSGQYWVIVWLWDVRYSCVVSAPRLRSWISSPDLRFCSLFPLSLHQALLTLTISPRASLHSLQSKIRVSLRFALPALTLTMSWEAPIGSQKQPHINQWGKKGDPQSVEIKNLQTTVWKLF